jgi:hypothetical protein
MEVQLTTETLCIYNRLMLHATLIQIMDNISMMSKICPTTHLWRRRGERRYSSYSFTTSALDGSITNTCCKVWAKWPIVTNESQGQGYNDVTSFHFFPLTVPVSRLWEILKCEHDVGCFMSAHRDSYRNIFLNMYRATQIIKVIFSWNLKLQHCIQAKYYNFNYEHWLNM